MVTPITEPMTIDDFEAFVSRPENQDRFFELVNGNVVSRENTEEMSVIACTIGTALSSFASPEKLGRTVLYVWYRSVNDLHNVRQPDVAFTRAERLQPIVTRGAATQLPDIAVEVQSPDDSLPRMREKAAWLIAHGVQLVWIALPRKRLVEVYRADGSADILTAEDTLDAGDTLPGFSVNVASLFEE